MPSWSLLAAALAAASQPQETGAPVATPGAPGELPAPPAAPAKLVLPTGTLVRLMVLNEVNSRDHKVGQRFVLRVDEEVKVNGVTVIPYGAKAWGEVVEARATGGAGKSGRLNARLLYVEAAGRQLQLDGARHSAGGSATGQVVLGVVAWGPFGLLMKGNNATLKAGEILNGYTLGDSAFELQELGAKQ